MRSAAEAKTQARVEKKPEIVLTADTSRAAVSSSLLSKQAGASPAPATTLRREKRTESAASPVVTKSKPATTTGVAEVSPVRTRSGALLTDASPSPVQPRAEGRLARVTAYWAAEGDYYTERCISATGVHLHDGHCAVDPSIIPYGSVVEITGVGKFLAVDTGSAVISRTAAREGGHTSAERNAIVIDLFFEDRSEGERFAAAASKFVSINWWTPGSVGTAAAVARSLFAEEDWTKIQGKQL